MDFTPTARRIALAPSKGLGIAALRGSAASRDEQLADGCNKENEGPLQGAKRAKLDLSQPEHCLRPQSPDQQKLEVHDVRQRLAAGSPTAAAADPVVPAPAPLSAGTSTTSGSGASGRTGSHCQLVETAAELQVEVVPHLVYKGGRVSDYCRARSQGQGGHGAPP
eukprot:TRINITY_DN1741_c0_g1_i1.p2 TRINITY_DN1741_c0_g1~~TRINITY_DN1741_c0_g1_i1.p2  ORF type:complete len:165 (-),score=22.68 TRINITY_DN1741_c0_g1_i1:465-959(-)